MTERIYSAVERARGDETPNESDRPTEDRIPDFPAECLPPILQRQARGISDLCGVPLGMSAPMVLATASISLGKGLLVKSLPGKLTRPSLYVLLSKTSGSGGSTTFKHAVAPLVGKQKTMRREFEQDKQPRNDAEKAVVSTQIDEIKRKSKRAESEEERAQIVEELAQLNAKLSEIEGRVGAVLYLTEATPEKLAEMLSEHGETLAHIDSDAADALGIIVGTRYGDGKHSQESVWLKSYSGDAISSHRKNPKQNGKAVHVVEPCLGILFVATPDKVQELFRNSRLTSGGLLPRFLVCDPGARPVALDINAADVAHTLPGDVSQPYESAIFAAIDRYRLSAADDPDEIDMTPAARRLIVADWNRFCNLSNGTEDLPFEARHNENAIRIALVLHAYKHVSMTQRSEGQFNAVHHGHEHPLDEQTARDAIAIRDWFTLHQEALRTPQRAAADDDAWSKAEAMLRDRAASRGITARDLYTGWRVCRDADAAQRLLALWVSEGKLIAFERKPAEGAGRPTTAYRLAKLSRG